MLYDMFKGRVFYYGKGPRCFKGVGLLGEQNKNERGKRPCKGNHPKEERQNQEDGEIVIWFPPSKHGYKRRWPCKEEDHQLINKKSTQLTQIEILA